VPRAAARAGSRGKRLAVRVRAGEPSEVRAVALTGARHEKRHRLLWRGGLLTCRRLARRRLGGRLLG
jgi:hypothetical protein